MRRFLVLLMVFAFVAAACGGSDGDGGGEVVVDAAPNDDGTPDPDPKDDDDGAEDVDDASGSGDTDGQTDEGNGGETDGNVEDPISDGDGVDDPFDVEIFFGSRGVSTLDEFPFGTPADEVISELQFLLGPPTDDTGSIPTDAGCPTNASTYRTVAWGGLELTFLSESQFSSGPAEHLAFWFNTGDEVTVQALIGDANFINIVNDVTTVGDLNDVLGSAVDVFDDDPFGPGFIITDDGGELRGELTGTSDSDVVLSTNAGIGCGE